MQLGAKGANDLLPPAMRYRVRDVLDLIGNTSFEGVAADRLKRLLDDGEPWLGADPDLAQVGYWMLKSTPIELRRQGCVWLTMFPSVETVERVAAVAMDPTTPTPVREQAIWTLGYRQVRAMHPSTRWSAEAVQLADETLIKLADAQTAAGKVASEQLPLALRHVQWEGASAIFARAPGLWGEAIECFASPAFARVLLVCLEDIPPRHRMRAIRLVGAVLGDECVPLMLGKAGQASIDEKLEMLFMVISLAGEGKLGVLEDAIKGMKFVVLLRQPPKWHLAKPRVVPAEQVEVVQELVNRHQFDRGDADRGAPGGVREGGR